MMQHAKGYYLFLQGPHGPFFWQLAKIIQSAGAKIEKIGFNQGDAFYWREATSYTPYTGDLDHWSDFVERKLKEGVSDLVLYGDERAHHSQAIELAKKLKIRIHYFEEGYLRPYWVTYERQGVNGHSPLVKTSIAQMRRALKSLDPEHPEAPARWGELRSHIFHGAVYHWQVLVRNGRYPKYKSHRDRSVGQEFIFHLRKLLRLPFTAIRTVLERRAIFRSGRSYHLVLMQLEHDASIKLHSDYNSIQTFVDEVIDAYLEGAPKHHLLVFKAHPLDDFSTQMDRHIRKRARDLGLDGMIRYVHGGRLARLLDYANSAVTINSTAAQQALWRGIPVKSLGRSVYNKPELVSAQNLADFFGDPQKPDLEAYHDYRRYLLATSQILGGFYSAKSRIRLLRGVVDMMLADKDSYKILASKGEAKAQQRKKA